MYNMKQGHRTLGFMIIMIALFAGAVVPVAHASFILKLEDGVGATAVITDNSAGDSNSSIGAITFSGPLGVFHLNVTTGLSKPVIGPARMDLSSVNVSGGSGMLTISLTDTDFNLGPANGYVFSSQIGGVTDGSVDYDAIYDPSNHTFPASGASGTTTLSLGTFGPVGLNHPFSGSVHIIVPPSVSNFSLTQITKISHLGGTNATSFNAATSVLPTPEPGTLALLGISLLGCGLFANRQRKGNRVA